jgi:hypothetical protein
MANSMKLLFWASERRLCRSLPDTPTSATCTLQKPEAHGISGHIEVQDLTPVVADDEKAVVMLRAA